METDHRAFQPINIGLTSVETGKERFTKDEVYTLPPISYWRCNLTALSQRYNLYFVASNDGIAVYQPQFPFQTLKRTPQLFIPLTVANPSAAGYIEPSQPHSANHILVGDLGNEEILLAATDSGNVVGYHTKAINDAIKKDPYRFSTNARSDYVGVRAFFSHWVFESAWGLAIHREGRMIAVSANVPHHVPTNDLSAKITVFAFALSRPEDVNQEGSEFGDVELEGEAEWHEWGPSASSGHSPTRDRNFKITLAGNDGHTSNIPSISFVNTSEDVEGSWLLSTDIQGDMKIWQIWRGTCYSSSDFAESGDRSAPWMRRREGGWLVAALDPLSFRPAKNMDQFCGHSKAKKYYGHVGESYDISNVVRARTPGNSQTHPLFHETSDEDDQLEDDEEMDSWHEEDEEDEDTVSEQRRHAEQDQQSLPFNIQSPPGSNPDTGGDATNLRGSQGSGQPLSLEVQVFQGQELLAQRTTAMVHTEVPPLDAMEIDQAESDADGSDDSSLNEWYDEVEDNEAQDQSESEEHELSFSPISHGSATSASSLPNRNSDEMEEERVFVTRPTLTSGTWAAFSKKVPSQYAKQLRRAQMEKELHQTSRIPFVPTLHCSTSHLRIVNAPQATSPHIFCAHLLKQILPPGLEVGHQAHFDRLNMMQQIPELGIVIVATQIGRCAVCTLTKKEETGVLGIRVDWILPTKRQERAGVRPFGPLLGIAVAPIQGRAVKHTEMSSEGHKNESWTLNRDLEGVLTTFDSNVIILGKRKSSSTDGSEAKTQNRPAGGQTPAQLTSLSEPKSFSSESSGSSRATTERRAWKKPEGTESWYGVEASRRYRLMMTYTDMTVLTYEISRGVESDDVAGGHIPAFETAD